MPNLAPVSKDELKDSCDFIAWLMDNHFTFLGYEEYPHQAPQERGGDGVAERLTQGSLAFEARSQDLG
jgi:NAD-specific glutamate dehydrogenase